MLKHPAWIAGIGALVVTLLVAGVLLFRREEPGLSRISYQADEGGGYICTYDDGRGYAGLLISLLPQASSNAYIGGGEKSLMGLWPPEFCIDVGGKGTKVPLGGKHPVVVLVDQSGAVLSDECPGSMTEVYEMMQEVDVEVVGKGGPFQPWAPPPPDPNASRIAALAKRMSSSAKPWPKPILDGMTAYVVKMEEAQKALDAKAGPRP